MENEIKTFYVKIKIDKDSEIMNGIFVSEEREHVDKWNGTKKKDVKNDAVDRDAVDRDEELGLFQKVLRDFEKSVNVFQQVIPFVMNSLPVMLDIRADAKIRKFLEQNSKEIQSSTSEEGYFKVYGINAHQVSALSSIMIDMASISQGIASMPDMFIVSLIGMYDAFLAQLIRTIFLTKPEILSSSDKNISFKDLVETGSIEAARDKIIEKEIDSILRESHTTQISWLEGKLSMPLTKQLSIWPDFVELCERRNLLTHTAGVVSSQYMKACKSAGVDVSNQYVGKKLFVPKKYYVNSVQTIMEFGIKLTQVIWRKLLPNEVNCANSELNSFSFNLISQNKYKLASTMLRFGLHEMKKHTNEAIKKQMIVNYANAEKLLGDMTKANEILDSEDWSASTDLYKICIAGVRDETDVVIKMMGKAVADDLISISSLREWPVFLNVRNDPKFIDAFESQFHESLLLDREAKSLQAHDPSLNSSSRINELDSTASIH